MDLLIDFTLISALVSLSLMLLNFIFCKDEKTSILGRISDIIAGIASLLCFCTVTAFAVENFTIIRLLIVIFVGLALIACIKTQIDSKNK